jgi:hypothetical protein
MERTGNFTVPSSVTELTVTMLNEAPGGCGNDFVLDDLSFRECITPDPPLPFNATKIPLVGGAVKRPVLAKKVVRKTTPIQNALKNQVPDRIVSKTQSIVPLSDKELVRAQPVASVPVPLVISQRITPLIETINTGEGEILVNMYDNGEIDGDTVSIYHNNVLIASQQRLSQKPISLRIRVDKTQPHHELVMVAHNLGSIPPNTSLMIVMTKEKRYQVSISSTEQQNAKVVIEMKE